MIVTAHTPNYLPGLNVTRKINAAHAVIFLDEVQYSHDGWSNRNRMPDGSWLTVPIEHRSDMGPFNRVRISEHGNWRQTHVRTLAQHYGDLTIGRLCDEILRPYRLLVGLNLALLAVLLDGSETACHFQSHLDGGHAVWAVGRKKWELAPISQRLAMMTAELGGTTYLSGPSGRNYLDENPFSQLGITVEYWEYSGPNDCAVGYLPAAPVSRKL